MTIKTTLENFGHKVWGYHLPILHEDVIPFIEGNERRVICQIKERKLHMALMPLKGDYFILMNGHLKNELGLELGQEVEIYLEKDTSEYGMDMPIEFGELLNQDDEGREIFEQLTPGKKRSLIYMVSKVKNTNSRLNKALAIVQHLRESKGNLDYKRIHELIKYYNNL